MLKRTQVSLAIGAAFSAGLIGLSPEVLAQQQLERVEVTGSRVKRIDAETASPVQTITREDIERTGKTSIQEILRTVTADSNGTIPTSFTNGFASGSAAVSLRGLGVNSTLVLVNGRRMSTYGLADDGTRNFVDLNSLPLEAVDRIEVLKDGASAIYGADAVGGVVNVILRRSYTGASVGASYGQTGDSDGQDMRAYGSYGFGNLETDKFNVFFTLEASKTKDIEATDRGFIGTQDTRSLGYFDMRNGANRPYFGLGPSSNVAVRRDAIGHRRRRPGERDSVPRQHRPGDGLVPLQQSGRTRDPTRDRTVEPLRPRHGEFHPDPDGLCGVGVLQYQDEVRTAPSARTTTAASTCRGIRSIRSLVHGCDDPSGQPSGQHVRRRSDATSIVRPNLVGATRRPTTKSSAGWSACKAPTTVGTGTPACSMSRARCRTTTSASSSGTRCRRP